jgi:hypothetical protein
MARLWDAIYRRVWHGEHVDPARLLRPEGRPPASAQRTPTVEAPSAVLRPAER